MKITASSAVDDPNLLGNSFAGPSWATWKACLRAAEGQRLSPADQRLFFNVAEREPPAGRVKEFWCITGRRGGKDSIASAIATTAAMNNYDRYLRPGERACIMCLAVNREQARIVHNYIKAYFSTNPLLVPLVRRTTDDGLELTNNVDIVISTNSFRAVRGRTIACVIFDECAFWKDEESANPDTETYNAVTPAMGTLPEAMLIGISTVYRKRGLLYDTWKDHYGTNDPDVLVVKGTTLQFNPSFSQRIIDRAIKKDPEAARSEWLSEWRSDLSDFISREVVDKSVVPGRVELPRVKGNRYFAFVDPAGGSGSDSMTLAIAHKEADGLVLDCLREATPTFKPALVVAEQAGTIKGYGIARCEGDHWGGSWPEERFAEHGIKYETCDRTKSEIYRDSLPLLNSGSISLLDNDRLITQICSLERSTRRNSKDSIDHPPGQHDDCANAALGALLMASEGAGKGIVDKITPGMLMRSRRPSRHAWIV